MIIILTSAHSAVYAQHEYNNLQPLTRRRYGKKYEGLPKINEIYRLYKPVRNQTTRFQLACIANPIPGGTW